MLSAFGIFLFPDRAAGWAAALRVLRPGGTLVALSWDASFPPMAAFAALSLAAGKPPPAAIGNATQAVDTFASEVEASGFVTVGMRSIDREVVYEHASTFIAFMLDNPIVQASDVMTVAKARRVALASLCGCVIDDDATEARLLDAPLRFSGRALVCVARKAP